MPFLVALLLLGLHLTSGALAQDIPLDVSQTEQLPVSLAQHFTVLNDPDLSLTLADVQTARISSIFKPNTFLSGILNFGDSGSVWWLRIVLRNEADQPLERVLEVANNSLLSASLFQSAAQRKSSGPSADLALPVIRAYPNRNFVFPVTLPPHAEQVYFLRLQGTSSQLAPIRLWMPTALKAHENKQYWIQGWFFGVTAAMVLFSLLAFVVLRRDVIHLLYAGFCQQPGNHACPTKYSGQGYSLARRGPVDGHDDAGRLCAQRGHPASFLRAICCTLAKGCPNPIKYSGSLRGSICSPHYLSWLYRRHLQITQHCLLSWRYSWRSLSA